ncbi:MAG: hypothetical protein UX93_C0003G0006 [Microgenomates group bacterium GW2011_GWC1_47_20]|nr:MAG: hypothetical protein UX93_C0003G0006 [Microgenomates group bacterium GW2011_GWC1_47_20]
MRSATEAARQAGREQSDFFKFFGQAVSGLRPAPEAGVQGTERELQILMVVQGPESWIGKGKNRHHVSGCASYVLKPDGSKVFVPGRLADASGGDIFLSELRHLDKTLVREAQRAIIADRRKNAKIWRGWTPPTCR